MDGNRGVERVKFLRISLARLTEKEGELQRELDRELGRLWGEVSAARRFRGETLDIPAEAAVEASGAEGGGEEATTRRKELRLAEEQAVRALVEQCLHHPVKGKRARLLIKEIEDVRSRIAGVQRELGLASQVPD